MSPSRGSVSCKISNQNFFFCSSRCQNISILFCVVVKVISRVCSLLQVSNLKDMHIDARRHLPAVQELQRSIKEINMFIEVQDLAQPPGVGL